MYYLRINLDSPYSENNAECAIILHPVHPVWKDCSMLQSACIHSELAKSVSYRPSPPSGPMRLTGGRPPGANQHHNIWQPTSVWSSTGSRPSTPHPEFLCWWPYPDVVSQGTTVYDRRISRPSPAVSKIVTVNLGHCRTDKMGLHTLKIVNNVLYPQKAVTLALSWHFAIIRSATHKEIPAPRQTTTSPRPCAWTLRKVKHLNLRSLIASQVIWK